MTEPTLARIFEPFFTTKSQLGGTGLGLASVYGFVKQCGGTVLVDSVLGHGTTMHLYFPILRFSKRSSSAPVECASRWRLRQSITVLVVDTDESVRCFVRRVLELNGCTVREASSGIDARSLVRGGLKIDLLMTTLRLPQLEGIELARIVRSIQPETCVVLMSGAADMRVIAEACDELRAIFLQKPFSTAQLMLRVHDALAQGDATAGLLDSTPEP